MNSVQRLIREMRLDAKGMMEEYASYPVSLSNELICDAYLLNKAAMWLERLDWNKEEADYLDTLPSLEVIYENDNDLVNVHSV